MAMILDAFAGKMVERLAEFVEESVVTVLGVKDEVKRLQRRMARIKHVLQDAERKRIQSAAVADWVRELKDVVYDADDIIDLCRSEGGKLLSDQPSASTTSRSVRCNFLLSSFSCCSSIRFRHEIGNKIKELNQRLEYITKDKSGLDLVQNEPDIQVTRVSPRQTTSLVESSDIVGEVIKRATEELVERIAKKEGEQKCRVFAITGMGGIGKTTLAQNIFNHQKITSEFSPKIWVCISQNFSDTDLVKEIIRKAGGIPGDLQTRSELLPLLQQIISGKPFFLVLDDVWREDVWVHLLRQSLQSGAIGSRILVTTRDQGVAMQMGTVHRDIHRVEQLPLQSGWELLCKSLYSSSQEEEMQSLRDVGIQIVEKCHGLPLAIKAIAGVLRTRNRSKREWEKVLRRDAWSMELPDDDLRGALYLSYEDLPSHLKQCFVFCSLFAEDEVFDRSDLVNYWVVEGFVQKTREDSFLEVADEYLEDLVRRNLVQKSCTTPDRIYKMHDLLRSLAQYLSGDESFCGEAHRLATLSTTTKLRRLTITDVKEFEVIPEPLLRQKKSLRTLFIRSHPRIGNDLFIRFPFLRLLMLSDSAIDNIPDAVGNLIHLRLLDLDRTNISNLPESISHLTNLEVLYLSGCSSLSTLPNGITRLCNLWFLDLHDTPLSFIPAGIGSLIKLNMLKGFVLEEGSTSSGSVLHQLQGCNLKDLKSLSQLRELSIQHLERAVVAHKGQMVLQNKPHLKMLELNWGESTVEHTNEIEEVFAELFPPPCLEELEIDGYYGRGFPGWMMSASLGSFLPQLTSLSLYNCTNVLKLPPLGLLPELRYLYISHAQAVVTMGPEFLGSSATSVAFPKLESLSINYMLNLEEWSFCGEEEGLAVLPRLQELRIHTCPKLESLPRGLKQSPLKMLKVTNVNLRALIGGLTDQLVIRRCNSLERISDFPALKELTIEGCPMLKSVEKVDALKRLKLELIQEDNECLPEWLLRLLQQRQQQMNEQQDDDDFQLRLWIGDKLLKRCLMGCEYWPIIQNVPSVNATSYDTNGSMLYLKYTKKPFSYDTNL